MKPRVSAAIITGWLFSTKSCVVAPGVRFGPSTPSTRMDMPRMSRSRSVADAAFANRIHARYDRGASEQADPRVRRESAQHRELRVHTRGRPRLVEPLPRTGPGSLLRSRLQEGDELRRDRRFVRRDRLFREPAHVVLRFPLGHEGRRIEHRHDLRHHRLARRETGLVVTPQRILDDIDEATVAVGAGLVRSILAASEDLARDRCWRSAAARCSPRRSRPR